jgi:hypothetical protein
MLDSVGLPRAALTDPDLRISTSAGRDLLEACSRVAEDFAMRLSELRTPSIMGPVALIIREQPTARGVLEAFGRYMSLHADSTRLSVEETDDVAIVYVTQSFDTPGPTPVSWADLAAAKHFVCAFGAEIPGDPSSALWAKHLFRP